MNNYEFCAQWAKGHGPHGRALDYGCGAGHIVRKFRQLSIDGYGCDVFYGGAEERGIDKIDADIRPYIAKIEGGVIPFPDAHFDCVTSNQVFEHVEDLDAVLKEIHRVLKPGGKLLAMFPDKSIWREGHAGIPFLHWFPKGRGVKVYYTAALRSIGMGFHKEDVTGVMPWSRYICDWVDQWTHYLSAAETDAIFARYFPRTERIELQWLAARLPGKPLWVIPAFVRSFVTRKMICGRVMVAVK